MGLVGSNGDRPQGQNQFSWRVMREPDQNTRVHQEYKKKEQDRLLQEQCQCQCQLLIPNPVPIIIVLLKQKPPGFSRFEIGKMIKDQV